MPKLLLKKANSVNTNVQYSSKYTDRTYSTSSVNYFTLKDNEVLSNKKLFIHYGNEKRDLRLEGILHRLNAEILEFFDDAVNFVITATRKNKEREKNNLSSNNKQIVNVSSMSSRSRKLVGLVQEKKSTLCASKSDNNNAKDFLDLVTEKGIRVIHLNSVWNWLRENHALLIQMILFEHEDYFPNEEENERRDTSNEVKKLIHPSLKIIDDEKETRPTYHSKCQFQSQMFEETFLKNNDKEQMSKVSISNKGDTLKFDTVRSIKAKKTNNKSAGGYCEFCSITYTNIITHFSSKSHEKFANNDRNYSEIDQVISNLSNLNSFLSIRIKKQKILEKRKFSNQLIKSLSSNDFKSERKEFQNKSLSFTAYTPILKVEASPRVILHNLNKNYEEILFVEEIQTCFVSPSEVVDNTLANRVNLQSGVHYNVALQEDDMIEEGVDVIGDMVQTIKPHVTIQENYLQISNTEYLLCYTNVQEIESCGQGVVEMFTEDFQHLHLTTVDSIIPVKRISVSLESPKLQFVTTLIQPSLHLENTSIDQGTLNTEFFNKSFISDNSSFCNQICWHISPPPKSLSPPLISLPSSPKSSPGSLKLYNRGNPISPFFLINQSSSSHYPLLTPEYEYSDNSFTSHKLKDIFDSPTQNVPLKDTFINLKKYVTEHPNNTVHAPRAIQQTSLNKRKPFCNLDNFVGEYFYKNYQILLPLTNKCLREITNNNGILNVDPALGELSSPGRLSRRAKTIARNSISLTTQLFLN